MEVDVELLLAVDVSRSVSPGELALQRRGYADALASAPVLAAISSGLTGRIALAYVEWAGSPSQRMVVDWQIVETGADAAAFAETLVAAPVLSLSRTSISGVLDFAADSMERNAFHGLRRVIDISGDGPNNEGPLVLTARARVLGQGITINGLPLMTREGTQRWHLEDLDAYYLNCVIGGPGAFVIPVVDWSEFAVAVRRKLVLEIAAPLPARPFAAERVLQAQGYDCEIGERIWRSRRQDWDIP